MPIESGAPGLAVKVQALRQGSSVARGADPTFPGELVSIDLAFYRKSRCGAWGKPDEIAATISFLLWDEASFPTGQTLFVDGGGVVPTVMVKPWVDCVPQS